MRTIFIVSKQNLRKASAKLNREAQNILDGRSDEKRTSTAMTLKRCARDLWERSEKAPFSPRELAVELIFARSRRINRSQFKSLVGLKSTG